MIMLEDYIELSMINQNFMYDIFKRLAGTVNFSLLVSVTAMFIHHCLRRGWVRPGFLGSP